MATINDKGDHPPFRASDLRRWMTGALQGTYPGPEARVIIDRLLEELAGLKSTDIALDPGRPIDENLADRLKSALSELKAHKPLSYITGKAYFLDLELFVNEHVLIPRPETEELVNWMLEVCSGTSGLKLLDIGTGSGCIALSLVKHLPLSQVTAIDSSSSAIAVAEKNAQDLGLSVRFLQLDILDPNEYPRMGKFHLVASNPPYVRESEKALMQKNVLEWEPGTALFVPDQDPLVYYKAILEFTHEHLLPGGSLFFEINEGFGPEMLELGRFHECKSLEIKSDIHGKDRMMRMRF